MQKISFKSTSNLFIRGHFQEETLRLWTLSVICYCLSTVSKPVVSHNDD